MLPFGHLASWEDQWQVWEKERGGVEWRRWLTRWCWPPPTMARQPYLYTRKTKFLLSETLMWDTVRNPLIQSEEEELVGWCEEKEADKLPVASTTSSWTLCQVNKTPPLPPLAMNTLQSPAPDQHRWVLGFMEQMDRCLEVDILTAATLILGVGGDWEPEDSADLSLAVQSFPIHFPRRWSSF